MALPFLLPVLLSPDAFSRVGGRLAGLSPALGRTTGSVLVGTGVLLLPVAALGAL
jgi:hypothetical protein